MDFLHLILKFFFWSKFDTQVNCINFCKVYWQQHPEVTVLDSPDAIQHVYNRQSMLKDVADLNLSDCHGKFKIFFFFCI